MEKLTCHKCKKTYNTDDHLFELQEFNIIDFVGGYGSVFGDGNRVVCNLCQKCLKKMIGKFCTME
jgi:hypothetical protein